MEDWQLRLWKKARTTADRGAEWAHKQAKLEPKVGNSESMVRGQEKKVLERPTTVREPQSSGRPRAIDVQVREGC
jgi:hypothetical protein